MAQFGPGAVTEGALLFLEGAAALELLPAQQRILFTSRTSGSCGFYRNERGMPSLSWILVSALPISVGTLQVSVLAGECLDHDEDRLGFIGC